MPTIPARLRRWPCSASTYADNVSNKPHARRQAEPATTAVTCSSAPTAGRLHPEYATRHFTRLVKRADIPPIRLHDLRHGAASLAHQAGADLKTVQDLLGHASIVTSVLPYAQCKCAEATARLVLAAARRTREKIRKRGQSNRPNPRKNKHTTRKAAVTTPQKSRSTPMQPKHDYRK
ncbi:tyrosine-type recombinase/integrase [Micromonospora sp. NPDC005215]|uniref:tyrosine-type recombinase/integrase n=1 Tax=Micromonospora sp. NPDC005215 TaxID=3157024 RepID=UPI0033A46E3B